jgi:hypothetical protein
MYKQNGGIIKNPNSNTIEPMRYFLDNSLLTILSSASRGGIIFELELKPGIISPFIFTRSNYPDTEVKTLIMKMMFIYESNDAPESISFNYNNNSETVSFIRMRG